MPSFNKVLLMGNLTRDPQLKQISGGTTVAEFGLALNRKFKSEGEQREETVFVDCTAFGKPGEIIGQYCQKGKSILVEGRLRQEMWEDKQTGQKRSKLTVVVESFQLLGAPNGKREEAQEPPARPTKASEDDGFPF